MGLLETVERIFDSIDEDDQGTIGFDEFFQFIRGRRHSLDPRHKQVNDVSLSVPPGARYKLEQLVWDSDTIRTLLVRSMERNYVGPVDIIRRWDQNGDRDIDEAEFVERIHLMIGRSHEALWKREIERVTHETFNKVARKPRDSKVVMLKLDVTELEVWLRGCPEDATLTFKEPDAAKEKVQQALQAGSETQSANEPTKKVVKQPWFRGREVLKQQRPFTAPSERPGLEALTPHEALMQRLEARLGDPRLIHRLLDSSHREVASVMPSATANTSVLATERGKTAEILHTHGQFWHRRRVRRLRNPGPLPTLLPSTKSGRPTTASLPRSYEPQQSLYGYSQASAWPSARASSASPRTAGYLSSRPNSPPMRRPRDFRF